MIEVIHKFTCEVCKEEAENRFPCLSAGHQVPQFPWIPTGWRELWGHLICPKHKVLMLIGEYGKGDRLFMSSAELLEFLTPGLLQGE